MSENDSSTTDTERCEFCGEFIPGAPAAESANGAICSDCHEPDDGLRADGGPEQTGNERSDFDSFTADEWESWLQDHPDHVLMFIDGDHSIHSMGWDGGLTFWMGGSYGYDYEGSRATLEQFAQEDGDAFKVVPQSREQSERRRLKEGHWDTPSEWAEDDGLRADGSGEPGTRRFGPATIVCPYCLDKFEVEQGPTRRCTVTHPDCDGGRIIVDLQEETAGKSARTDGGQPSTGSEQ